MKYKNLQCYYSSAQANTDLILASLLKLLNIENYKSNMISLVSMDKNGLLL